MADDLRDLASKIQRERNSKTLTTADLDALADKITLAGQQSRIDPRELANVVARSTAANISSRIPSMKEIAGAFINSSPILRIAGTVFNKSFGSVNDLLNGARLDQSEEAGKLLKEIESMRDEMLKSEQQQGSQAQLDVVLMNEQVELLRDILEQTRIMNGMVQEEETRKGLERLQGLDNGVQSTEIGNPNASTDALLGKMLVLQERSLAMSLLQSVGGFFTGFASKLSGMLGGLLSGGLLASLTRGMGFLGRLAGPIGLVVTGAMQLYDGFTGAAKFLGDENASLFEKIQYAGLHLMSSIIAPFDWAISFFTGEESNLRGKFETAAWQFQENVMSFIQPALDIGADAMKWIGSVVADVFKGIDLDTKLTDLPGIMADNITGLFIRAWDSIDIAAISDQISTKLKDGQDFATRLYESIMKTTADWFKTLYDNMLEWVASGLEETLGSTFGGFIASKTRDLKTEGSAPKQKTEEGLLNGLGTRAAESTKAWFASSKDIQSNSVKGYKDVVSSNAAEAALRANATESQRNSRYNPDTTRQERPQPLSLPPVVQQTNVSNNTTNVGKGMQVDPPGFGYRPLIPSY